MFLLSLFVFFFLHKTVLIIRRRKFHLILFSTYKSATEKKKKKLEAMFFNLVIRCGVYTASSGSRVVVFFLFLSVFYRKLFRFAEISVSFVASINQHCLSLSFCFVNMEAFVGPFRLFSVDLLVLFSAW